MGDFRSGELVPGMEEKYLMQICSPHVFKVFFFFFFPSVTHICILCVVFGDEILEDFVKAGSENKANFS